MLATGKYITTINHEVKWTESHLSQVMFLFRSNPSLQIVIVNLDRENFNELEMVYKKEVLYTTGLFTEEQNLKKRVREFYSTFSGEFTIKY
jgi:hypothetical protein